VHHKNPVLVGARFYDDVTQPNKFQFLSLLGNCSVKIPLSLLGNGSIKIPLSLLGYGSVETLPR
jgi:hypothetical protein